MKTPNPMNSSPPQDDLECKYRDGRANRTKKQKRVSSIPNNKGDASSQGHRDKWSEGDVFMLLEVWGIRYMKNKNLKNDDWDDLVKVLETRGVKTTVGECVRQVEWLKSTYEIENRKFNSSIGSDWVFRRGMDALLNQRLGTLNEKVGKNKRKQRVWDSDKLLVEAMQRIEGIPEKLEKKFEMHMTDLEKMRNDIKKELEIDMKNIMKRGFDEILKIREMDDNNENHHIDASKNKPGDKHRQP